MEIELQKQLEEFFESKRLVKYKKGEVILRSGVNPGWIGYIKSGYVRMYTINENGTETTIQFFKPILYLTLMFAYTGIENRYFFEAITPVEMYTSPTEEALKYFTKTPSISQGIMNNIMKVFLDMMDNYAIMMSGNAYNRVAAMVAKLVKKEKANGLGSNDFGITHKLIASLTGLTRETVTLQMIKLEKEGAIVNKSKTIVVKNWEILNEAAMSVN